MGFAKGASRPVGRRKERAPFDGSRALLVLASLVFAIASVDAGAAFAQATNSDALRLAPIELLTDEPSYLELGAGAYDLVADHNGRHETFAADAEYLFGQKVFFVGPAAGVIADARGGGMVYAGIYSDLALGPVIVTPLWGIGAWWRGGHGDEDLGGTFEFRLSLAAAYQFADRSRFGLRYGHISSAGINKRNPGENDLMLTYGTPLQF